MMMDGANGVRDRAREAGREVRGVTYLYSTVATPYNVSETRSPRCRNLIVNNVSKQPVLRCQWVDGRGREGRGRRETRRAIDEI